MSNLKAAKSSAIPFLLSSCDIPVQPPTQYPIVQATDLVIVLVVDLARSQVLLEEREAAGGLVPCGQVQGGLSLVVLLLPIGPLAQQQLETLVVTLTGTDNSIYNELPG